LTELIHIKKIVVGQKTRGTLIPNRYHYIRSTEDYTFISWSNFRLIL